MMSALTRATRYREPDRSDHAYDGPCARCECTEPVDGWIWVTIRGIERWKRFCVKHKFEEQADEDAWKVGL